MYTVFPETIGLAVIAPKDEPWLRRRKRQRTLSRGIVWASIAVASSARRFERPPFADVHDAPGCDPPHADAIPASETAVARAAARVRARSLGCGRLLDSMAVMKSKSLLIVVSRRYSRVVVAGRGVLVVLCALGVVLVAAQGGSATRPVGTRASASGPLPCSATFKRLVGGTGLGVRVTCQAEGVVIVRITFPTSTKLASQHAFAGAVCQDSTPRMWNCLFRFGVPTTTVINGTVKFAKALPRRPERATVDYYEQVAGELNTLPHTVDVDPVPFVEPSEF
jgi:hypothetical protein